MPIKSTPCLNNDQIRGGSSEQNFKALRFKSAKFKASRRAKFKRNARIASENELNLKSRCRYRQNFSDMTRALALKHTIKMPQRAQNSVNLRRENEPKPKMYVPNRVRAV
ncbi:hypothetical protein CAMGR0001_0862 [Campylobacter gracilis RM3268]|uniref:Uncharacterized protein n=1 Tax=Campylobacter gracilis RM3268 TaxID=553220 RepID=C8PG69_9BACT|nr:hypothetical protein CAMGR0001_0862 [Campylobacter gracilis RM3268]